MKIFFPLKEVLVFFIPTIRGKTYIFKNHCYDKQLFYVNDYVSCFVCDAIARDRMNSVVCEERERETQGHWRVRTYLWIPGNSVMPRGGELWLLDWILLSENCDSTVNYDPSVCTYRPPIKLHRPVISVDIQSEYMWNFVMINWFSIRLSFVCFAIYLIY